MAWFDQIGTGIGDALVNMQQPFGMAPPQGYDRNAAVSNGALQLGMGMLANPYATPMEALGKGYQQAQDRSGDQSMKALAAQQMIFEMDQKKRDRAQQEQQELIRQRAMSGLSPDELAVAQADPEGFMKWKTSQTFKQPEAPSTTDDLTEYAAAKRNGYQGSFIQFKQDLMAKPEGANKPAAIQEYEYAKQQGFPGTFQDWEASKKGGMALSVDPNTGQVTFQQGGNIKPLTESQSKDTVFSTRAKGALEVFDQIESGLVGGQGLGGNTVGQIPGIGNYLKTEDFQKAEQAGQEFLQALLRKDTGAAITTGEQALYGSVYLPKPGDGPDVIAQKKESRARAVAALEAGMTPQAILAQEQALAKTKKPTAGPGRANQFTIKKVSP